VQNNYPLFNWKLDFPYWLWDKFKDYRVHPAHTFKNFICSFNGTDHVGRKLLVAAINKFGYFNPEYVSKNFTMSVDTVSGHLSDYVDNMQFYSKFFIGEDSQEFFNSTNSFGLERFKHEANIYNLESKLTDSFLHIASESMATSLAPYVSEKFLYSVVTRGLYLSYAQPGWHQHLFEYYGFKPYTQLFDYTFDSITNPVKRLVELMTMIGKFSRLSTHEWNDLYLLELDTIEYNYYHYFSGNYLKHLEESYGYQK
jgi:hypothetical protein